MLKKILRLSLKLNNALLKLFAQDFPYEIKKWLATNYPDKEIRHVFFKSIGIEIGIDAYINQNVIVVNDIYAKDVKIKIGNRVAISPGVIIISASAPNNSLLKDNDYVKNNLIKTKSVIIDDDVWIGAGAIILSGVTIGKESIIGAGAIVTTNVPEKTVVSGVPARIIRRL